MVLFDGVCNLCNSAVQFAISHDRHNRLLFASLQGKAGSALARERAIDTGKTDSIIFIEPGVAYYTESAAALKIADTFGGGTCCRRAGTQWYGERPPGSSRYLPGDRGARP